MDKLEAPIPSMTEQQQAQHTVTVYISRASALLTQQLSEPDSRKEKSFGDLAKLLLRISRDLAKEVDGHQSLKRLDLLVGMKESTQKDEALTTVVNALSCEDRPQRIVSGGQITFIAPSILPGIFVQQVQRMNGSPTNKLHEYSLVGEERVPMDYQAPLTPRV